ncbi:GHMP kinase domain containing protein [Aphelenchoides besseyi]|nr:GHMP kinase domain containing protein [Aphelenchoides besseyi]KAI6192945.1 GHMP kinase domain containing protein [Aphelenchoides besseyi]
MSSCGDADSTTTDSTVHRFSAPGKTILFGEHAVVYGKTAIAGSIGLRTTTELWIRPSSRNVDQIELNLSDLSFCRSFSRRKLFDAAAKLDRICREDVDFDSQLPPLPDIAVPLAKELIEQTDGLSTPVNLAMLTFLYVLLGAMTRNREIAPFKLIVSSKVPVRVGLGSSAAYCVSLCAAILRLADIVEEPSVDSVDGKMWTDESLCTIERWAKAAESLIHGKTSGLDVVVCARGGLISYQQGQPPMPISCKADLRVIIVNTRVERNTLHMVGIVKQKLEKYPEVLGRIFDSIDEIAKEAARLLTQLPAIQSNGDVDLSDEKEYEGLQELCRINNHLLNGLGVGHAKSTQICALLARYGIHTKLSGAGGGGTCFAFITKEASPTLLKMIEDELCQLGFELWRPNLGGCGVMEHQD